MDETQLYKQNNERILKAFRKNDQFDLRRISGEILSQVAVNESKVCLQQANISYALSKLISKPHFSKYKEWELFKDEIKEGLENCEASLQKGNLKACTTHLDNIVNHIEQIDENFGHFLRATIEKAGIRAASHFYASGMSLGTSAELAGVNPFELKKYLGHTKIHDELKEHKGIKRRLSALEKIASE